MVRGAVAEDGSRRPPRVEDAAPPNGPRAPRRERRGLAGPACALLLGALAVSCGSGDEESLPDAGRSEHARPSMPDSMAVPLEPMPEGPSLDSMAAQMERAFEGGTP